MIDPAIQPTVLRAHRPKAADSQQPLGGDVVPEVETREVHTEDLQPLRSLRLPGWFQHNWPAICLGIGSFLTVYMLLTCLVIPWWNGVTMQWNYGNARVTTADIDVGHGGTSHFVAQYYKKQIVVIEMPIDHPEHSTIYSVPATIVGDTSDHVVTLAVDYVNPKAAAGKPDLVVTVSGFSIPVVLYNTGTSFKVGN